MAEFLFPKRTTDTDRANETERAPEQRPQAGDEPDRTLGRLAVTAKLDADREERKALGRTALARTVRPPGR